MSSISKSVMFTSVAMVAFASSTAVLAADREPQAAPGPAETRAGARDASNGDIIVTAQRRAESINKVGLSITAATAQQLANAGIRQTADLVKIAPGLTVTTSLQGTPVYNLRAVGFNDFTLGASPAVSVYVDQVSLPYSNMTTGAILDLERVEVLKGPQGITYGQNSTGGAINYIAAKPRQELGAGVQSSFERFNQLNVEGFITGPVATNLSARVAVSATEGGAWQYSYTHDGKLGNKDLLKGRFQLLWEPTVGTSVLFSANGWRDRSDTQAVQLVGLALQKSVGTGGTADVVNARIAALEAYPLAPANARAADWDTNPASPYAMDNHFYQLSLNASTKLNDGITLASITAFSKYHENYFFDRDGMTLMDAEVNSVGDVKSFSQEIRLFNNGDQLNWLLGANYASNVINAMNHTLTGDATNTAVIPGLPISTSNSFITQDIEDKSAFANLEYKRIEKLTLLAGARYTVDRNDFTYCQYGDANFQANFTIFSNLFSGTPTSPLLPGECTTLDQNNKPLRTLQDRRLKEDNISYRFGANYELRPGALIYVLAARGYKSGSFPNLSAASYVQTSPVTQESVMSYEGGFKLALADRKLQINGAAFYYEYGNKQVRGRITDPIFNQLELLVNIPRSRIEGAELEIAARPIDGLALNVAGTYVDTRIQEYTGLNNAGVVANFRGSDLPYSPKLQVTASADYVWPLSDRVSATIGASALGNTETNSTLGSPALGYIRGFTTVDLRAGLQSPDGRWRVSIYGRNIFNEYYWINQFNSQDAIVRYAAKPVTYGVSLSLKM